MNLIYLNVNGILFSLLRNTLEQITLFNSLLNCIEENELDLGTKENPIFVDRDDDKFEQLLAYMIHQRFDCLADLEVSEFEYDGIYKEESTFSELEAEPSTQLERVLELVETEANIIINCESIYQINA